MANQSKGDSKPEVNTETKKVACTTCGGSGLDGNDPTKHCATCNGSGTVKQ